MIYDWHFCNYIHRYFRYMSYSYVPDKVYWYFQYKLRCPWHRKFGVCGGMIFLVMKERGIYIRPVLNVRCVFVFVLFFFVLCTIWSQLLWTVYLWLSLRYSLMCIYACRASREFPFRKGYTSYILVLFRVPVCKEIFVFEWRDGIGDPFNRFNPAIFCVYPTQGLGLPTSQMCQMWMF